MLYLAFGVNGFDVEVQGDAPAFSGGTVLEDHLLAFFVPSGAIGEEEIVAFGACLENRSFLQALDD